MAGRARAASPFPFPSPVSRPLCLSRNLPQLPAEIQNLKAARCRGRRQKTAPNGQARAKRVRFRDFAIVPPWGIKVIKRLSNLDPPQDIPRLSSTCRYLAAIVDLTRKRGGGRVYALTRVAVCHANLGEGERVLSLSLDVVALAVNVINANRHAEKRSLSFANAMSKKRQSPSDTATIDVVHRLGNRNGRFARRAQN